MSNWIVPIVVGLAGGLAVGVQNPLASVMAQRVGILESAFIIHLGGALAAGVPLAALGGGGLSGWRGVPWYSLGAGALGVVLICAVSYTIPRVGIAATVGLIVTAQLTLGALLDHSGAFVTARPFELGRVLGIGLLIVGSWLVLR